NEQALNHETDWVMKRKMELFNKFLEVPMPRERQEEWRYTYVEKIDMSGIERKDFSPSLSSSDKIIFTDMRTAVARHSDILRKYFLLPQAKEDKISLMQKIFWTNGIFVYVPKNMDAGLLTTKIFLDRDVMSYTLIILESGGSAEYFEEITGNTKLMTDITEIYLSEGAKLDFYLLQNTGQDTCIFSNKNAFLGKDASMSWVNGSFGGKMARLKTDNCLKGLGSSSNTNSFFIGNGKQHIDITTNAIHLAPHTTNNIANKGILKGSASSVYRGMIKIEKEAQKTVSYLSDNTIMLGNAVANSIPGLMIDANDVKASHGSTIGQIDESQIFYLTSRGITKEQAEKLIIEGFIDPSIEMIKSEGIKEIYKKAVEAKSA
ncbi:MAG: Fe-S cluster assembly protein SufD, partial [Candidatus Aenigmarchaeota archaeon]|nr:Fe-S cluster assembly protein SufD [Candidatus Aenigmarchaeota archaeon]MDI6722475.1 Fe-S cluster assembly protein SufD [Candidatus Aenigmarchaeota archaeon]